MMTMLTLGYNAAQIRVRYLLLTKYSKKSRLYYTYIVEKCFEFTLFSFGLYKNTCVDVIQFNGAVRWCI